MPTKRKAKKQRKKVSARSRVQKKSSESFSTVWKLPEGVNQFKVDKKGVYLLDFIPYPIKNNPHAGDGYEPGDPHYERTFFVHYTGGKDGKTILCGQTFKNKCPVCDYKAKLSRNADADPEDIEQLKAKERQLFNVIDIRNRDRGIQIFECSYWTFGKLLEDKINFAEEEDGYEYFADPQEGFTVRVAFKEENTGGFTYFKATDIEFRPRKKQYTDAIIDEATNLDDLFEEKSYKAIDAEFQGSGFPVEDSSKKEDEEEYEEDEEIEDDEELEEEDAEESEEDWDESDDEEEAEEEYEDEEEDEELEEDEEEATEDEEYEDEEYDEEDEEVEEELEEDEEDDDWDEEEIEEEEAPAPKKKAKKTAAKKAVKKRPAKKTTAKKKSKRR